jgi:hypothetical protein
VLYGFSPFNAVAEDWREKIVESISQKDEQSNMDIVDCTTRNDISKLGMQDFTLVFVSKQELKDISSAMTKIQSCLDSYIARKEPIEGDVRVVVLTEGTNQLSLQLQDQVSFMIEALSSRLPSCKVQVKF